MKFEIFWDDLRPKFAENNQKNIFELFDPKKIYHPTWVTPNGQKSKKKFFSIFGIRMTQFAKKKQKKNFELFDPKKFYHPRWGDPQWAKIKRKIIFGI